jgi:peptide/nickel transport system ATP-binding protein
LKEILRVEDLTITFSTPQTEIVALRDVSLSVKEGEIVGIVGESGAGKSVLCHSIVGSVEPPGRIVNGKVIWDDRNLLDMEIQELQGVRGKEIALICSNPHAHLNPLLQIGNQIANIYRSHFNVSQSEAWDRSVSIIESVGIPDAPSRARAYPHELSGGMAQRILIGMALICKPRLIIADEPMGGLDVTIQMQILELLETLLHTAGASTLIASRDLGLIANLCSSVLMLRQGTVVESADVDSFFHHPKTQYTSSLINIRKSIHSDERKQSREEYPNKVRFLPNGKKFDKKRFFLIEQLYKKYEIKHPKGTIKAVTDLTLEIEKGETLGLVGESGSGKTTTGLCILQLEKLTSGKIFFENQEISLLSPRKFRQLRPLIQGVFQNPHEAMSPRLTIRQTLQEPLLLWSSNNKMKQRERIFELIDLVKLDRSVLSRYPHELSGGQLQRVAIAMAIANNPKLIILDEPTSSLDASSTVEMLELLVDLQKRFGISYLLISHDLWAVKDISHRVAVMYLGQIVESGPTQALFNSPKHPYTEGLLSSMLLPDPRKKISLVVLKGEIPSPINLPKGCRFYSRCRKAEEGCQLMIPPMFEAEEKHFVACFKAQPKAKMNN